MPAALTLTLTQAWVPAALPECRVHEDLPHDSIGWCYRFVRCGGSMGPQPFAPESLFRALMVRVSHSPTVHPVWWSRYLLKARLKVPLSAMLHARCVPLHARPLH